MLWTKPIFRDFFCLQLPISNVESRYKKERNTMYQSMWKMFQNGQITEKKWLVFSRWYLLNIIMVQPSFVETMVRLKNR